jgi:NTP pyrophosphatase (non-canonical NTP hydrolase)
MDIKDLQKKIYDTNAKNGWHEDDPKMEEKESFLGLICNCHSEISEAFEEFKNNRGEMYMNGNKPEGLFVELADAMIYIMDFCEARGVDIGQIIEQKTAFNATRGYRHGNKRA